MEATFPDPVTESVWSMGARTVKQACRETGLSRLEIWSLMDDGTLPFFNHGGRGTRIIAWKAIVELLEREHKRHTATAKAD